MNVTRVFFRLRRAWLRHTASAAVAEVTVGVSRKKET
jgi:hypothetical protein